MTNAIDRRRIVELVNETVASGARLRSVCAELGIGQNTYTLILVGPDGTERRDLRVVGEINAPEFLTGLNEAGVS